MAKLSKRGKLWLYIIIALIVGLIIGALLGDQLRLLVGYVIGSAGKAGW